MSNNEFPQQQFEELNSQGHAAKNNGDHAGALETFEQADDLAVQHGNDLKRIHALTPEARALWSTGDFEEADAKLQTAADIAEDLGLVDEQAITMSNFGRLWAVKAARTLPMDELPDALREKSVPFFELSHEMLEENPHLYYRFANGQHGTGIAAIAGQRALARSLFADSLAVAPRRSPEPYDQIPTWRINTRGLGQLAVGAALIPLGNKTPGLSQVLGGVIR